MRIKVQGLSIQLNELMLPVEVVRSVYEGGRQSFKKHESCLVQVQRSCVRSGNHHFSFRLHCEWNRHWETPAHSFHWGTPRKNTLSVLLSVSFSHTEEEREWQKKAAYGEVACACHSPETVIFCAVTSAVIWLKSALIVSCVWTKKKSISLLLHENTAKISMTFLKSCFSDTEIEIRWLAGETNAFLPFWTSHSLRLGAQALHKMSIDKFSSAYVTHAQFESYRWGRKKRRLFRLGSALLMNFCDRAANVQHGATAAALDGERARRGHYATPWRWCLKCLLLLPIHPSTLQPPHRMNIRIHKPQRSCQSILVLPAFDFSQSKSFWQRFPASKKRKK